MAATATAPPAAKMSITPSTSVSSTTSTTSSSSSRTKPFWPRELFFASPHPSQLSGGSQRQQAPMCPCHDCWEYGSHAAAAAVRRAVKEEKKQARAAASAASAAAVATGGGRTPAKKTTLDFFRRNNSSRASVASDMRPLRQSVALASPPASVYECEYEHNS